MDFLHAVNEVQRGADAEVFKAATSQEVARRTKDYEEMKQQEFERRMRALGPKGEQAIVLSSDIRNLIDEYNYDGADWVGNYGKVDYMGPEKISFNIKIYNWNIPDSVQEKLDKMGLAEQAYEYANQFMADQLEWFADEMVTKYDFIEKWWVDGRSGGWLVFDVSPVNNLEDTANIIAAFNDLEEDSDWMEPRNLKIAIPILKQAKRDLEKRMVDLRELETLIEKGKKGVTEDLSSEEFWANFFEGREE